MVTSLRNAWIPSRARRKLSTTHEHQKGNQIRWTTNAPSTTKAKQRDTRRARGARPPISQRTSFPWDGTQITQRMNMTSTFQFLVPTITSQCTFRQLAQRDAWTITVSRSARAPSSFPKLPRATALYGGATGPQYKAAPGLIASSV